MLRCAKLITFGSVVYAATTLLIESTLVRLVKVRMHLFQWRNKDKFCLLFFFFAWHTEMNVELERKDDGGEMKMAWTDE